MIMTQEVNMSRERLDVSPDGLVTAIYSNEQFSERKQETKQTGF